MKLIAKTNNQFKNTLLHNTEIPLHRIYSKTEEDNNKIQKSILYLSSFNDNDYDSQAYIMSKNDLFNNFDECLRGFIREGLSFNDKYIKGYISYITNTKNNLYTSDNLSLYMNKENISKIKIPAYLTKKYMHDNKLSFNKNIRYKLLNKESSNLIITDHRFHCMFLDFIPEEYKDYYVIFDDSFKKNNTLNLRTKCECKEEEVYYHSNLELQDLPIGEIIVTRKFYDTFKEATFDLITKKIKNTKTIEILTSQTNTKVRQGKYSKVREDEHVNLTNDSRYRAYFNTPHISNYFE